MKKTEYASIGETLYTSVLPNGLPVFVITKPGYRKTFAIFATNYGGADRRFKLGGEYARQERLSRSRRADDESDAFVPTQATRRRTPRLFDRRRRKIDPRIGRR